MERKSRDDDRATPAEFAEWLRQQLISREYDLRPRGGGQGKFVADSGIGAGTVSRMLSKEGHVPGIDVLEQLAAVFQMELAEVLVAAGIISRSLLPAIRQHTRPDQPITPQEAAADLGITHPHKVELFVTMTESLRDQRAKNGEENVAEN
ncbi:helix-turn-helix transcriptional regulator [Streptomyces sp. NPDC005395]|uniref:helix-turn-helix domain-containing protein n=1 Tax=Streptomyces sp. NPDC005395 TaxID=3157042 RepID=UPI00339F409D